MERYKNIGGNSSVVAFEIGEGSIVIDFSDGSRYLYTSQSAGASALAEMQRRAVAGRGLNSYVSRFVRKGYARRLR